LCILVETTLGIAKEIVFFGLSQKNISVGLKKNACNISAKSELGRFPITDYIKTQAMLYFCRLQADPINLLLKEAFSFCKSVDSDGIYLSSLVIFLYLPDSISKL
jgi:hypothetical protein